MKWYIRDKVGQEQYLLKRIGYSEMCCKSFAEMQAMVVAGDEIFGYSEDASDLTFYPDFWTLQQSLLCGALLYDDSIEVREDDSEQQGECLEYPDGYDSEGKPQYERYSKITLLDCADRLSDVVFETPIFCTHVANTVAGKCRHLKINAGTKAILGNTDNQDTSQVVILDLSDVSMDFSLSGPSFKNSEHLESVIFPKELNLHIDFNAFSSCPALHELRLPQGFTDVPSCMCRRSGLTTVELPMGCWRIGKMAFMSTNLSTVRIPSTVTYVGQAAFNSCASLTTIDWVEPEDVQEKLTINKGAFKYTSIEELRVPKHVQRIDSEAFAYCPKLHTVYFSDGFDFCTIAGDVFEGSWGIETVRLPAGRDVPFMSAMNFYNTTDGKILQAVSDATPKENDGSVVVWNISAEIMYFANLRFSDYLRNHIKKIVVPYTDGLEYYGDFVVHRDLLGKLCRVSKMPPPVKTHLKAVLDCFPNLQTITVEKPKG